MFTAVIDAGSSGTRLFLYQVEPGAYPRVEKIAQREFATMPSGAREDGINNFVDSANPKRERMVGPEVIEPLLDAILPILKAHGVSPSAVEVNLFATAGMRYAEALHGSEAIRRLYGHIEQAIAGKGFAVGEVRTARGAREEGLWTWTHLNDSQVGAFTSDAPPVGIIEVGGSSTQFSFPVDRAPDPEANVFPIAINGRSFAVFCRSYLGLGQDDARKAMRQNAGGVESSVCFPTGFSAVHDLGDELDGVASFRLEADGRYDFDRCTALYDAIIRERLDALGDPRLGEFPGEFVGIDGAYHATGYWGVADTPLVLQTKILDACHDAGNFEGIAENEHVQGMAANATYVNALLFGRYGVLAAHPQKLVRALPSRIGDDTRLTWTRGYLLLRYGR